jgi:hypothetical protein
MPSTSPERTSTAQSITTTFILLTVLLLAFFPSLFHYLWYTPLYLLSPLTWIVPPSTPHSIPKSAVNSNTDAMSWFQKSMVLPSKSRGSYLITDTIVKELPEIKEYKIGLLNLFIQHTSASKSISPPLQSQILSQFHGASTDTTEHRLRSFPQRKLGLRCPS